MSVLVTIICLAAPLVFSANLVTLALKGIASETTLSVLVTVSLTENKQYPFRVAVHPVGEYPAVFILMPALG